MSIENSVYEFIAEKVGSADADSPIKSAIVHADTYEEIRVGAKWIRVDDVRQSVPVSLLKEENAYIEIQFVAKPLEETLAARRAARFLANKMALEMAELMKDNRKLNTTDGTICLIGRIAKRNEWRQVGKMRLAVSFLMLQVNP